MWVSRDRFEALEQRVRALEAALGPRPETGGFQPGPQAWPSLPAAGDPVPALAVPETGEADLGAVREALAAGNKIQAIKVYRERTGVGLKEAKDAVDAMERLR